MKVYRIEHPTTNCGPYRSWTIEKSLSSDSWMIADHNSSDRPSPWGEGWQLHNHCKFGFKTIKQLKAWFIKEERKELKKLGFKLFIYEIEDAMVSDKQVMFEENKAKRLKEKEIPLN